MNKDLPVPSVLAQRCQASSAAAGPRQRHCPFGFAAKSSSAKGVVRRQARRRECVLDGFRVQHALWSGSLCSFTCIDLFAQTRQTALGMYRASCSLSTSQNHHISVILPAYLDHRSIDIYSCHFPSTCAPVPPHARWATASRIAVGAASVLRGRRHLLSSTKSASAKQHMSLISRHGTPAR